MRAVPCTRVQSRKNYVPRFSVLAFFFFGDSVFAAGEYARNKKAHPNSPFRGWPVTFSLSPYAWGSKVVRELALSLYVTRNRSDSNVVCAQGGLSDIRAIGFTVYVPSIFLCAL